MRKFLALVVIASLALSAVAIAQPVDPDPNQMGVYFDTDATVNCAPDLAPGGQISIYLMLTNPTYPQVSAWECRLIWDQMGGGFYGSWTLANGGLNVGDLTNPMNLLFAVGTGAQPIVTSPATILAQWDGYYAFGSGSTFTLTQYPGTQSFPNEQLPGYAADEYTLVPCGVSSGSVDVPCAAFGAGQCAPIANEDTSWSNVKELYK